MVFGFQDGDWGEMKYSKVYKQILNALMDFLFIDVELVVIVVIDDPTSGRICLFLNYVELVNYCYCYCCDWCPYLGPHIPTAVKAFCQPRSIAQLHSDLKHKNTIKI